MLYYKSVNIFYAFHNKINLYLTHIKKYHAFINNFESKIKSGILKEDILQRKIVDALVKLDQSLKIENKGIFHRILDGKKKNINKGLYIYGSVGSGKTMLMNMFYDMCDLKAKKRIHFHEFMMEVHKEMHEVKKSAPKRTSNSKPQPFDPIPIVADIMCRDYRLLCFDEFQVTDIADAMILRRLFEVIFRTGILIIATSNRHPDDLYKQGLQRSNFIPFIGLLKDHCDIMCLDSEIDYRKLVLPSQIQKLYITPKSTPRPSEELQLLFNKMTNGHVTKETVLTVFGRHVTFSKTIGPVLYATFEELCQQPLSAADYLEIAKCFHTVFLENIPQMKLSQRNRKKRFITMIDAFYDNRIRLICSAEKEPEEIFLNTEDEISEDNSTSRRILMDDLGMKETNAAHRLSSIFTDEEEIFSHDRAVSRLIEMRTHQYWEASDHPLLEKK